MPIEGTEVVALLDRYPFFARDTIPAHTYPGVDQTEVFQFLESHAPHG